MGYNNVPVNGWPQIKKLEELDALAKKIDDMPVFTSTDRAWLDEWESALPSLAQDVSDMETDKANQVQMATAEESTTASQAYSAGDYLVLDGVLYKVTDDIAQDGTIVTEGEGKNVDLATVGGELSGLNSKLNGVTASAFGSSVDLADNNDWAHAYTCPSDGYVVVTGNGTTVNNRVTVYVNNTLISFVRTIMQGIAPKDTFFIKAGMKVNHASDDDMGTIVFIPFV